MPHGNPLRGSEPNEVVAKNEDDHTAATFGPAPVYRRIDDKAADKAKLDFRPNQAVRSIKCGEHAASVRACNDSQGGVRSHDETKINDLS